MLNKLKALYVEEQGQGMTEYGLVLAVIAIGIVGTVVAFKGEIVNLYNDIKDTVTTQRTSLGS